jgi:hypothetical protein
LRFYCTNWWIYTFLILNLYVISTVSKCNLS